MSFDILFHKTPVEPDAVLDEAAAQALSHVVVSYGGPAQPNGEGYFWPGFDLYFSGESPEAMLELRGGIDATLMGFIFDVIKATGWIVVFPADHYIVLSTVPTTLEEVNILNEGAELRIVTSPKDVAEALAPGFKEWSAFRDSIPGNLA